MVSTKRCVAVLLAITLLSSITTPTATTIVLAEGSSSTLSVDESAYIGRALVLQNMLRNALALNISAGLKSDIEGLLAINVSTLSTNELAKYIANASLALARVENEVRSRWNLELGNLYAERLRNAIEARARAMERHYGIQFDDALRNISRVRDLNELNRILKDVEKGVEKARLGKFTEGIFKYSGKLINTSIEEPGSKRAVNAYEELSKIEEILKSRVSERLGELNVSDEVLGNISEAIEHISIAKELIAGILGNASSYPPERAREMVRGTLNKSLEKLCTHINESIEELKLEVSELISKALEANATEVASRLKEIKDGLSAMSSTLQRVNISGIQLNEINNVIAELARIRAQIKIFEADLKRQVGNLPVRAVDNAFNITFNKAVENLNETKSMLEFINNTYKNISCTGMHPTSPVCKYLEKFPDLLKNANSTLHKADEMLNNAKSMYDSGMKVDALITVNKANAMIMGVKAMLQPIYRLLKSGAQIGPGKH